MINNPANAMRMLITYAICVPIAICVGYLLANQFDYGTLGILGLVFAFVFSPIFIKWHYPIMIFALGFPATLFFLKGSPSPGQVMVPLSLGIAIVERALNRDRKFLHAPMMVWPLFFTIAMVAFTAKLTGGIGLHTFGNEIGGGKKYVNILIGIATFFALISRPIPKPQRTLYIGLFFLAGLPSFISDLFPVLPTPLTYINLLFPPSTYVDEDWELGTTRLGAFSVTAEVIINFMLVRYGLRGIFLGGKIWRVPVFLFLLMVALLGGFRIVVVSYILIFTLLFFFEKLYRTKLLPFFFIGGILAASLMVPFANKLPFTFQRALSFLPINVDRDAKMSADATIDWRLQIWRDTWPKVPQYLLIGKGYALSAEDFEMIGNGGLANGAASKLDSSEVSLAVSGDYHSGPLSTLMPFGIWGAISILWIMYAALRITYLNYKFGDPDLKIFNTLFLVMNLQHCIVFFLIFGAYDSDVSGFAKMVGFSIAMNRGICGLKTFRAAAPQTIKPVAELQPAGTF